MPIIRYYRIFQFEITYELSHLPFFMAHTNSFFQLLTYTPTITLAFAYIFDITVFGWKKQKKKNV